MERVVDRQKMSWRQFIRPIYDGTLAAVHLDGRPGKAVLEAPHPGGRQVAMHLLPQLAHRHPVVRNPLPRLLRMWPRACRLHHARHRQRIDEWGQRRRFKRVGTRMHPVGQPHTGTGQRNCAAFYKRAARRKKKVSHRNFFNQSNFSIPKRKRIPGNTARVSSAVFSGSGELQPSVCRGREWARPCSRPGRTAGRSNDARSRTCCSPFPQSRRMSHSQSAALPASCPR
jgi:hypothetical protein